MIRDDDIQRALKIGDRNKEIIQLAKNWCGHLQVEHWGGTGLLEIQTGLPIGSRMLKCPHARAGGLAGMDLETVALDFYDRNCFDCKQRIPVRFPNISGIVAERDASRQKQEEARANAQQALANQLAARANVRRELSKDSNPAKAGIFASIEAFDNDPSDKNRRILLQTAAAVPDCFDASVQESLFQIADGGGFARTDGAIEVLGAISTNRDRLVKSALRAIARHHGHRIAASVIGKYLSKEHAQHLEPALPGLFALANPVSGFLFGGGSPGNPEPVLTGYRLFPEIVLRSIREHLRHPDKYARQCACNAISLIVSNDPTFGTGVVRELITSIELPDDDFGEDGSASDAVVNTLADIMLLHPDAVDQNIQEEMKTASEDVRETLIRAYERVLRRQDEGEEQTVNPRALEVSYQRLIILTLNRADNECLLKAIWFLRDEALRFPDLFEKHAEALLGAAALIADELEVPQSPLLDLEIKPDAIKQFEIQGRRQMLNSLLDAITKAIGTYASQKSETLGRLIVTSFQSVGEGHEYFKTEVVRCMGFLAASPSGLFLAIPVLYQAMTSPSTLVRAASASAYGQLAREDTEGIPSLLHESFLLLLRDPYVIVHAAAVKALANVTLPAKFNARIVSYLAVLVSVYVKSKSNDELISACLERILELTDAPEPSFRQAILSIVENFKIRVAFEFTARHSNILRGTTGYGKLIIKLITAGHSNNRFVDDLVNELAVLSADEIKEISHDFRAAATALESTKPAIAAAELIEILTAAGAWKAASDIARDATARLSDTVRDRPLKLKSALLQAAVELEVAASNGHAANLLAQVNRWHSVVTEIEKDNEENKKRRDPLFGLLDPDKSN
ncbi:MAG: hypothetical protein ACJ72H_19400 [Candidatus Sulfotelmatobacter sp.]